MKAIILSDERRPALVTLPDPSAGQGQVVVKVDHCGICGSDLHAATFDIFKTGITMGHEFAGKIVDVGKGVGGWSVGERVCVNPNGDYCGECDNCKRGLFNLCPQILKTSVGAQTPGGFAEFAAVSAKTLHRLPPEVTSLQGAWVEPASVALRAVRRSNIQVGDDAVVFGAGPIGLLVVAMLRQAGVSHVSVVEPNQARRSKAEELGATLAVDPRATKLEEVFGKKVPAPLFAFDCVGSKVVMGAALKVLRTQGRLIVVGVAQHDIGFAASDLIFKEIEIKGSFIYNDEFDKAIAILASGGIDVARMTSDVRPLDGAVEAFEELNNGADLVKIVISGDP